MMDMELCVSFETRDYGLLDRHIDWRVFQSGQNRDEIFQLFNNLLGVGMDLAVYPKTSNHTFGRKSRNNQV